MENLLQLVQNFISSTGIESIFIQVFIIGLVTSVPIGPWSVVAIEQTKKYNKIHGLTIAFIASFADILMALIALYFFTKLYTFAQSNITFIYLFTGGMLTVFGIFFLIRKTKPSNKHKHHRKIISLMGFFNINKALANRLYSRVMQSHAFIYIATFIWSFLHPGNILTYLTICMIVQNMNENFLTMNVITDFAVPLFLGTWLMWSCGILLGNMLSKHLNIIFKTFGIGFVLAGTHLIFNNII